MSKKLSKTGGEWGEHSGVCGRFAIKYIRYEQVASSIILTRNFRRTEREGAYCTLFQFFHRVYVSVRV